MKHLIALAALALPLAVATETAVHATFAETEVVQNQTARLTLRVPHGCGDEATLRVRIQIPEGVISAQPMVKAGWALETETTRHDTNCVPGLMPAGGVMMRLSP